MGNECPEIEGKRIDDEDYGPAPTMSQRADSLLRLIRFKTLKIGNPLDVPSYVPKEHESFYGDPVYQEMMAWSESTDINEVLNLTKHVWEKNWLTSSPYVTHEEMLQMGSNTNPLHRGKIYLTVKGYNRLEELEKSSPDSLKAFVAMWFDDSMDKAWEQGIKPAITSLGYEPVRIDKVRYEGRIDNLIIANIKHARFVVADFTQDGDNARGGVYYEAGFAHGLGIPVFFTCRKDSIDKVHFDTRQYRHILWTTPKELKTELENSLLADIGYGPLKSQNKTQLSK